MTKVTEENGGKMIRWAETEREIETITKYQNRGPQSGEGSGDGIHISERDFRAVWAKVCVSLGDGSADPRSYTINDQDRLGKVCYMCGGSDGHIRERRTSRVETCRRCHTESYSETTCPCKMQMCEGCGLREHLYRNCPKNTEEGKGNVL